MINLDTYWNCNFNNLNTNPYLYQLTVYILNTKLKCFLYTKWHIFYNTRATTRTMAIKMGIEIVFSTFKILKPSKKKNSF